MKAELLRSIAEDPKLIEAAARVIDIACLKRPRDLLEAFAIGLRAIADKLEQDEPWWNAKQDPSRRQLGQG